MALRDEITELTRRRILEAARDLFYSNGYQGTTLDAIAERLAITKPVIYVHFRSKDQLLSEVARIGTAQSLRVAELAAQVQGSASAQLEALAYNFVQVVVTYQKNVAIFFHEQKYLPETTLREVHAMQKKFDNTLADILTRGVKDGEFDISDVRLCVLAVAGMISWIYSWYRPEGRVSEEALAEQFTDMVMRVARARA